MAQWFRALDALLEDPGLTPSSQPFITPSPGDPITSSVNPGHQTYMQTHK